MITKYINTLFTVQMTQNNLPDCIDELFGNIDDYSTPGPSHAMQNNDSNDASKLQESDGKNITSLYSLLQPFPNPSLFDDIYQGICSLKSPYEEDIEIFDFEPFENLPYYETIKILENNQHQTSIRISTNYIQEPLLFAFKMQNYTNLKRMLFIIHDGRALFRVFQRNTFNLTHLRIRSITYPFNKRLEGDPVKDLLEATDKELQQISLYQIGLSQRSIKLLSYTKIWAIDLVDIIIKDYASKLNLERMLNRGKWNRLCLISRISRIYTPHFRHLALTYISTITKEQPLLNNLCFTIDQEHRTRVNLLKFPNLTTLKLFYNPLLQLNNVTGTITQIANAKREGKFQQLQTVEAYEYLYESHYRQTYETRLMTNTTNIRRIITNILPDIKIIKYTIHPDHFNAHFNLF